MKANRQLYIFLVKCAAFYIIWNVVYYGWIRPHTDLQMVITSSTTTVSTWILNQFDEDSNFIHRDYPGVGEGGQSVSLIYKNAEPLISVADSCNALTLMVLFLGFILAYPGDWRLKLIYIPVGCAVIFLINIVRVQVLIYNYMHFKAWFEFNHKYTFTIAVYLAVFYFWMLWANKYSKRTLFPKKKMAV